MSPTDAIRSKFQRNARAVAIFTESMHRTAVTEVRLDQGLRCEIEEGPWKLVADMSEKWGGASAGPNPGVLGRGALGSCLAMNIATWAAVQQLELRSIRIRVEADYDARSISKPMEFAPGYEQVRIHVWIESPEGESEVRRLMSFVEQATAYIDTFRRPMDVRVQTEVVESASKGAAA